MKTITIEGQLRTDHGKKATRHLRSEGKLPGVIYGGAKEVSFVSSLSDFKPLVYTSEFMIAEVAVDGNKYQCVLKDLQFDKVTDELIHVDLLELVDGKKVIVNIPIKFVGTPEGVKTGGRLVTKMKSLKVKADPKDLKENIELNIEKLQLDANIRVEDVDAPQYEILNSPRIPIASVVLTRALKQAEVAAEKEAKKK